MNPELLKALRAYMQAHDRAAAAGIEFDPAAIEAFFREETGGKFGAEDALEIISTIDPSISARNLSRSAIQGAAMNFGDEALGMLPEEGGAVGAAKAGAAGALLAGPPGLALGALLGLVKGGEGPQEEMRLREDVFRERHPIADAAAGMAGAVAPALAFPASAPATLGRASARGAVAGGLFGGLSGAGAGEGDLAERAPGAAMGAAGGAALGGALPSLFAALRHVPGVRRLVGESPEATARRRVQTAIRESEGGDAGVRARLAAAVAANRGDDVMAGDLTPRLRSETDFAASNAEGVFSKLEDILPRRQANQAGRVLDDVTELAGDANSEARLGQLVASRREWAASEKGFEGLRQRGQQINAEDIVGVLQQPKVSAAWREANEVGLIGALPDPGVVYKNPSFEMLQNVKERLDDAVSVAFRQGRGSLGTRLAEARDAVKESIEKNLEDYPQILAEYRRRMKLEEAARAGAEWWEKSDSRQLGEYVAKLTAEELEEFRLSMASELIAKLRSAQTNRNIAKQITDRSAAMEDKLKVVFGSQANFDKFMQRVGWETEMSKQLGSIGGSATHRRGAAAVDPDIPLSTSQVVGQALRGAGRGRTRSVAAATGPMLMQQGPKNVYQLLDMLRSSSPADRFMSQTAPAVAGSLFDRF